MFPFTITLKLAHFTKCEVYGFGTTIKLYI